MGGLSGLWTTDHMESRRSNGRLDHRQQHSRSQLGLVRKDSPGCSAALVRPGSVRPDFKGFGGTPILYPFRSMLVRGATSGAPRNLGVIAVPKGN